MNGTKMDVTVITYTKVCKNPTVRSEEILLKKVCKNASFPRMVSIKTNRVQLNI